jgi:asparagine synthase (glutamine-hydrolysing)
LSFLIDFNYKDYRPPASLSSVFTNENTNIYSSREAEYSYDKETDQWCVADGKIRNRHELCRSLNLLDECNLAEIALEGFKQLGDSFFDLMDGRYSLGIINLSSNKIIGLRDHFGHKSLFYTTKEKGGCVLSSNLIDIIQQTPLSINHSAINNYLDINYSNTTYSSETLYQDVYKVLPGHSVFIENQKVVQKFYWNPNILQYANLRPEKQAEVFRKKLSDSVKKNILPKEKICSNLSGGLDSSSVSSIAKMLGTEVNSLYYFTGKGLTDERNYANSVVKKWKLQHHEIQASTDSLGLSKKTIEICGMPDTLFIPGTSFFLLAEKANELGCSKILTGDGGDAIVAYGTEYLDELYAQKNWSELKNSIEISVVNRDLSSFFEGWKDLDTQKKVKIYTNYFFEKKLWAHLRKRELMTAFGIWLKAFSNFRFSTFQFAANTFTIIIKSFTQDKHEFQLLKTHVAKQKADFYDTNNISEMLNPFQREHFGYSFTNLNMAVIEQQNTVMQSMGIEAIHPFLDKELIEISVAISSFTRFNMGYGRGILRQAMKEILPEDVRLRTTKVEFSNYFFANFSELWSQAKNEICASHRIWKMIDKSKFDRLIIFIFDKSKPSNKKSKYIWLANRTIQLALWLDFFDQIQAKYKN